MRILSLVVAGVLALSVSASTSWASPSSLALGGSKAPAAGDKAKPSVTKKPGSKAGEVNMGSAARQELLKKRQEQSKSAKGKASALPKKTVKKKS